MAKFARASSQGGRQNGKKAFKVKLDCQKTVRQSGRGKIKHLADPQNDCQMASDASYLLQNSERRPGPTCAYMSVCSNSQDKNEKNYDQSWIVIFILKDVPQSHMPEVLVLIKQFEKCSQFQIAALVSY